MNAVSQTHPQLVPVPIPDRVASLIGGSIPIHVLQAEVDAVSAATDALRYRPLASNDDRADREDALSRLARANKVLAKHHPQLPVRPNGVAA
ncbi:hypothetical protein ACIGO8_08345 [Streptomyces sp. NPDC053493]|uniref:hypothetical protein n=1 Tax=Streptomyces sp. NPDC053493 TaxID=3365705 RepID=UPI0037D46B9B